MKYRLAALLSAAVIVTFAATAFAVPDAPDATPEWELDIDIQPLQSIQVTVPGEKTPQTFWFIRYTVSNHTGEDQVFAPEFVLYTDKGTVIEAGKDVPPAVFNKIKQTYNDPLLKDQSGMVGKLLQGEDNAKNGVAIFRSFDLKVGTVDIFVGGLSGHVEKIKLPVPVTVNEPDRTGKIKPVEKTEITLVKTLHMQYRHPLDPAGKPRENELKMVKQEWIMR